MTTLLKKPAWLDKKIDLEKCRKMETLLSDFNLSTVCQQALCPNISECFSRGTATFLILGEICTRNCRFCGVKKGRPSGIDLDEPKRIARAVAQLGLNYAVITSVTRDDLPLGGAEIFARTVAAICKEVSEITIEILIPDFKASEDAIKMVVEARPEVIGHNVETVPRLYRHIRQDADYRRSLKVLETIRRFDAAVRTKSAILVGLGEEESEVLGVFSDLRWAGCDFLSVGQYLAPSSRHYPVKEFVKPDMFLYYRKKAIEMGFSYVASGPYVRSSYFAEKWRSLDLS